MNRRFLVYGNPLSTIPIYLWTNEPLLIANPVFFADLEPEVSFDGIGCGWCTRLYLLVAGSPKTRFRNTSLIRYGRTGLQISSTPNAPVGRSEVTSAILTEKITLFSSFHRFLVLNRKFRSLIAFQHRLLT